MRIKPIVNSDILFEKHKEWANNISMNQIIIFGVYVPLDYFSNYTDTTLVVMISVLEYVPFFGKVIYLQSNIRNNTKISISSTFSDKINILDISYWNYKFKHYDLYSSQLKRIGIVMFDVKNNSYYIETCCRSDIPKTGLLELLGFNI
jgi:hypothetical protein